MRKNGRLDRQKRGRSFKLGGKKSTYQAIIYEKATNKGKRTSTQTHRLTGYGSSFGYIPPRNPRSRRRSSNRNRSHALAGGRTTSAISSELPRSLRVKLDTRNKKPRCVESAENMYRQYQRKLAETVKDKYVPRAAHFAALKRSSTERNSHASGLRSTANGTSREGIHAILERAKNRP